MSDFHIKHQYKAIAIGGSAGSFQVITKILNHLPKDFDIPIMMCLHRLRHVRHGFVEALNIKSSIEVQEPEDKQSVQRGGIYLAPANYHLQVDPGNTFSLSTDDLINNSRPAIDLMFHSAAAVYRHRLIAILLSGANRDGALGMKIAKDKGGLAIVQDPSECLIDTMPTAALKITPIDYQLNTDQIIRFLAELHEKNKAGILK
ncbi:chemotaxis protein CheB [Eisenibacter elegans]|jgi:two-component system chemotaxis response regulator CheB|uniref:chemotaxis protein CheB n=1 Tax=Eisenibacter elegans TaxID=997 RepID=UPI00040A7C4E|nr:chemotaxis protein CheB [Eisenibacter elegans]